MMEKEQVLHIAEQWNLMTEKVFELETIEIKRLQELLKETYQVLNFYHKEEVVPKTVCQMLLEVESFLYFASMFEGKEVKLNFYYFQLVDSIVEALTKGFFEGKYKEEYPMLSIKNMLGESTVFDLENGSMEELLI